MLLLVSIGIAGGAEFTWQESHAKILPKGDLEWAPRPFAFEKGQSVRYVDFDNGDDSKAGTSPDTAWKRHPWDANATGNAKACSGVHTYVFKRGVFYRGTLVAIESGQPGNPIRLTSDPAWGAGEAVLAGSERVALSWKKADAQSAPGIPEPEKVWYCELGKDFTPRALWEISGDQVERVHLARHPNWGLSEISDPQKEWLPWKEAVRRTTIVSDPENLGGKPSDFFKGGMLWTEWNGNMGTVHARRIEEYLPTTGSLRLSRVANPAPIAPGNRYFIENVRGYLDSPGEYFHDPETGRLFIRLAEDRDPNQAGVEFTHREKIIDIIDKSHIVISGLQFSFASPDGEGRFPDYNNRPTSIRVAGDCEDIHIRNCKFYHVNGALAAYTRMDQKFTDIYLRDLKPWKPSRLDNISFNDNDIRFSDQHGCVTFDDGKSIGRVMAPDFGRLKKVEILRNRFYHIGNRPGWEPYKNIATISVLRAERAEIAGNMLELCWGTGIFTHGGKASGSIEEAPLVRLLIHHNKVVHSVLATNDYGGISPWQGGPAYVYNNISGNAVGYKAAPPINNDWKTVAYNLYLDGTFKTYSFNNILWGLSNDPTTPYRNRGGYFVVLGYMNHFFNNTVYRFRHGIAGSSGNRSAYLGNVVADISGSFIQQNRAGDTSLAGGGDTGEHGSRGVPSLIFGNNIFAGPTGDIGNIGKLRGRSVEDLGAQLAKVPVVHGQLGWRDTGMPLVQPDQFDFRLKADSSPIGKGVRFFCPWSLTAMVGEWNFYQNNNNPEEVMGENFYMTEEYLERHMYDLVPRNSLKAPGATLEDYVEGDLEDWTKGAMRFNGKDRYCVLPDKDLKASYDIPFLPWEIDQDRLKQGKFKYPGEKRKTVDMSDNNFLIEIHFKTDPGHENGVLVSKSDGKTGYELGLGKAGAVEFNLKADGRAVGFITEAKGVRLNDGNWHHLVVEVDRPAREARVYIDGITLTQKLDLDEKTSLSNTGDFLVGKGVDGRFFAGAVDFLRVGRGTLADSKTSIEELRAWQFDGPFLRDFTGAEAASGQRDAGAIQYVAQ
jgi:hypothetical protein